ncbi:hypothetical protein ABT390_35350 [Streptomyces aurantiacus]|uniref:ABC transporter substrate-binding protein n=1 Tax=Streptomyces aurantiacus JA 4570 TaxID=1286094 RepID=S3ZH45_9ACTN|nr:hypothetical protein [Streptomyces aurantiacus]EPH42004.1 hypothetical protein STRAU_4891 [Streptomyces aurantiacus JA 4570]
MTPNSPSSPGSLSRRSLLSSTAAAALAVAGGAPLLAACGGGGARNEGTTTGKKLKDLLPAYVASDLADPDIPSRNGSAAGFTKAVPAAELKVAVPT